VLGKGSYGEVVEGFDKRRNTKVAIKRIQDLFVSLEDAKRIVRELTILRQLNHPNVIKIVDVVIPEVKNFDEVYIVFEMMDTDLNKLSKDTEQVISIM
jgi:mitogen-activated protein kinase 1/3